MNFKPEFEDLTKAQVEVMTNGCGTKGWNKLLPQFVFGGACNNHDFDFWCGFEWKDFLKANKHFLDNMLHDAWIYHHAGMIGWFEHKWFVSQAYVYYSFVMAGGWYFFEKGKAYKTWSDVASVCYPIPLTEKQKEMING